MGLLDRLLGRPERRRGYAAYPVPQAGAWPEPARSWPDDGVATDRPPAPDADDRAVERYRYLLRTAPPEAIEEAHAEAFAQLTPAQRQQVLVRLAAEVPERERPGSDDPRGLARMATRAEMRSPGTLERSLGGGGVAGGGMGGVGLGGLLAGGLLASVAGAFIGTSIAAAMFDVAGGLDGADAGGYGGEEHGAADGYGSAEGYAEDGYGGDFGGDVGGDLGGDIGGDFGGEF